MTTPKRRQNLTKKADRLFSVLVRSRGVCEADDGFECAGPLQCAHGFSRRYRAVRWDERNAFCLCASHHMRYTQNPLLWDDWLREKWGTRLYDDLRAAALMGVRPDLAAIVADLTEKVAV